ncbi:Exosome RNA helicase MTR4 [Coelomomyces lativittatus]|nr:Exosome RNA helicase MTR4 [Coelomomyces lativittatus]
MDMKIESRKFKEVVEKRKYYEEVLHKHPLTSRPEELKVKYNQYLEKIKVSEKIKALRKEIKASQALLQHDELKARKRVLRRLGFTNEEDIVQLKGRVACEISTSDPLLLTEMLFNGVFTDLTVEQCVALLGVFTFLERSKDNAHAKKTLRDELANPLNVLLEIAKRIAHVSKECKLEFDEMEYLDSFKPDQMEVVYAWANGAKFSQICKMTDVFEGNLVRSFRLLEELLRQMTNAAKAIGNQDLEIKFSEGITKIKRDIIFANSLYL